MSLTWAMPLSPPLHNDPRSLNLWKVPQLREMAFIFFRFVGAAGAAAMLEPHRAVLSTKRQEVAVVAKCERMSDKLENCVFICITYLFALMHSFSEIFNFTFLNQPNVFLEAYF